jgi:hypothetical protein
VSNNEWIVHFRQVIFIGALIATIENTVIPPGILDTDGLSGHAQMLIHDDLARQDLAQEVESLNKDMDDRDRRLGDLGDLVDSLTETEEDRRRRSLDALTKELMSARQEELEALLAGQEAERDERSDTMTEQRKELKEKYADSPAQEQHLKNFDQMRKDDAKDMADDHANQVLQFDEQWQQKFEQLEANPLVMPANPERNRDDDDR